MCCQAVFWLTWAACACDTAGMHVAVHMIRTPGRDAARIIYITRKVYDFYQVLGPDLTQSALVCCFGDCCYLIFRPAEAMSVVKRLALSCVRCSKAVTFFMQKLETCGGIAIWHTCSHQAV